MLQGSVSTPVDASPDYIWRLLTEKIEVPALSARRPSEIRILHRSNDVLVREMVLDGHVISERVIVDNGARKITYHLLEHPFFEGYVSHQLLRSESTATGCILAFTVDWRIIDGIEMDEQPDLLEMANDELFHVREYAEKGSAEDARQQARADSQANADLQADLQAKAELRNEPLTQQ